MGCYPAGIIRFGHSVFVVARSPDHGAHARDCRPAPMMPSQAEGEIPLWEALEQLGGQGRPKEIYPIVTGKFPDLKHDGRTVELTCRALVSVHVSYANPPQAAQERAPEQPDDVGCPYLVAVTFSPPVFAAVFCPALHSFLPFASWRLRAPHFRQSA